MGSFKCYWPGGPLDPYRRASLSSYGNHGHSVDLYSQWPLTDLPRGVTTRSPEEISPGTLLEAQLISNQIAHGSRSDWIPIDLLQLRKRSEKATPEEIETLAWIEAFKLWLPEYDSELKSRFQAAHEISIHLNFADMAGIDLHYLPPQGSFLYTIIDRHEKTNLSAPRPILGEQAVRECIRSLLNEIQPWTQQHLIQCCGSKIIKDLKLMPPAKTGRGTIRSKAKAAIARLAKPIVKSFNI